MEDHSHLYLAVCVEREEPQMLPKKSNNIQKIKMNCLDLFHFWCKQEYVEDLESVMNALGIL